MTWVSIPAWTWHHMWVEFVVGSCPCFEGFSLGPSSCGKNISNSNLTWKQWTRKATLCNVYCLISIPILISWFPFCLIPLGVFVFMVMKIWMMSKVFLLLPVMNYLEIIVPASNLLLSLFQCWDFTFFFLRSYLVKEKYSKLLTKPQSFNSLLWLASYFSSWYYPRIKCKDHEEKGNNHQPEKLLIVKQILLVSISEIVERVVRRIYTLTLGYKRLGIPHLIGF